MSEGAGLGHLCTYTTIESLHIVLQALRLLFFGVLSQLERQSWIQWESQREAGWLGCRLP